MSSPTAVLVHGWLGFRRILFWDYFRGVSALYAQMGIRTLVPELAWGGGTRARSVELADQLAEEPGPLHLIAHSMGGIDARRYIALLGGYSRVASLTTLSTPHRGSMLADVVQHGLWPFRWLAGVHDLTPEVMARFNDETPDSAGIVYRSYSAARPVPELPWLVRHFGRRLEAAEGENDSQVSVHSSPWGEHLGTLHADHFELIGLNLWLNPFRRRERFAHLPVYRAIGEWILDTSA
jgi:triacylglycerol lipase